MEQARKVGFFKRVWYAIKDFDKYQEFALETTGKAVAYFLKLMICLALFISIGATITFLQMTKNVRSYLASDFPEFTFENNTLKVEQEDLIELVDENSLWKLIIIDTMEDTTSEKKDERIEELKSYETGIVLLGDKLVLKLPNNSALLTYSYQDLSEDYGIGNFDKTNSLEQLRGTNLAFLIIGFYFLFACSSYIFYTCKILPYVVLLSVLGVLASHIFRVKLRFMPILHIAIYAYTLPIVLNGVYGLINILTGFQINHFDMMCSVISYIYLITAIALIRSDYIKKQAELMKIVEVQEQVRMEIERRKQEEELERQKEEQKKKEREKAKREKKKREKESGAPEGSKA